MYSLYAFFLRVSDQKIDNDDRLDIDSLDPGRFEALGQGCAVRPTIISPGPEWTLRSQPSLLAPPASPRALGAEEQRAERGRALDLVDALTRFMFTFHLTKYLYIYRNRSLSSSIVERHSFDLLWGFWWEGSLAGQGRCHWRKRRCTWYLLRRTPSARA